MPQLKNASFLICFAVILVVILLTFKDLTKTFYQQDEWHGLGLSFAEGVSVIFNGVSSPLDLLFAKGRIASNAIYYLFVSSFPLQNVQMAVFAVILHIVATVLVFTLIKRFIQNSGPSLVGALFFAVNAVSHSAVTWSVIAISVVGSSIIILLSTFSFFKFIETSKSKWLLLTGFLLYISLWFKEIGLYLFMFFPLASLIFKKYNLLSFIKRFWVFFLPFLLIVGYRVLELRFRTTTSNLYLTGANENFFLTLLIRAILYPLTSLSLMFVPGNYFIEFARVVIHANYPFLASAPNFLLIAQTTMIDILSLVLTIIILFLTFLFLRKEKPEIAKYVVFWLAFSLFGIIPYVVLAKDFSYLEGRYYYLPVVGGAFLFAWLLKRVKETFGKNIFFGLVFPLSVLYLMFHANVVRGAISEQVRLSNIRRDFMTKLKTFVPSLDSNKNVFYIVGGQNYWADGNKVPFQQGTGYTLMVLYNGSKKVPKEFLKEAFLFDIGSQGYKEIGGYGFGYFWDKEELEMAIKLYDLTPSSIISLHYDSDEGKLSLLEE